MEKKIPKFVFVSETLGTAVMEIVKKRKFYTDLMPHLQGLPAENV